MIRMTFNHPATLSDSQRWYRLLLLFLVSTSLAGQAPCSDSIPERPFELLPYRVRLLVAFDAPNQSPAKLHEMLDEARRVSERCIGSVWQLTVEEIDWVQPASRTGLRRLQLLEITSHTAVDEKSVDIWFVAAVCQFGSGWRIDVRSWQPDFRLESDAIGRDITDERDLPLTLVQLCHSSFSPVGRVDDVEGKTAKLELQGGTLLIPDESFALVRKTKAFVPVLAYRNRERRIEKLQAIPWTYLTVSDSSETRLVCEINSGLRTPISGKQRGRVSTMAVGVRSPAPMTRLELATQSKPSLPLIAHRIELRDSSEIPKPDDATRPDEHLLKLLLTDRRGFVSIPSAGDSQVVWLFAYSGKHLLARVPFVPGSTSNARLEVPDDAPRLEAESELQVLQGRLIESVAARNTLYSRIRAKLKKNELSSDESEEKEIRNLSDARLYLDRLIAVRVPAVKAAKARKDRASEARINRMCDEMAELIRQYLNEEKRQQLLEELKELRVENKAILQDDTKPATK